MANWFAYDGQGDPNLPGSYQRMTLAPNCGPGAQVCAIYLNDNSTSFPGSIAAVQDYIANALGTLIPQPNGGGGIKHFVYLKDLA